jgi:two-component system chemotaxis response regulator CheY
MRALIVDDPKATRMILGRTLLELGFDIAESRRPPEGARPAQPRGSGQPHAHWNMPVMNGYELIRAIRSNALPTDLRIMMVTTETSLADVEKALAAGANEYLMKPFTKELLVEKLALLGLN